MRPVLATQTPASVPPMGLLARLKDPQVWVCAIAAFTLLGLSTGLLGGEPATARAAMVVASAASTSQPDPGAIKP